MYRNLIQHSILLLYYVYLHFHETAKAADHIRFRHYQGDFIFRLLLATMTVKYVISVDIYRV